MTTATATLGTLEALRPRPSFLTRWGRTAQRKPLGAVAMGVVLVFVITAVFADLDWMMGPLGLRNVREAQGRVGIAPYDPVAQHYDHVMQPPSAKFWLGTDNFGRDMLSRLIHGARISLIVGITTVAIGAVIGGFLGISTAFFEGKYDLLMQRVIDAWMAFPGIIIALSILAALGPGMVNVIIAIGLGNVPVMTRVVRGATLSQKQNVFVEAARSIGCGGRRIMVRHLLPNVAAPMIIISSLEMGAAIISEASLSFLGVGVPPPNPSWGGMLSGHHRTYMLAAPWMAIFPGLAITIAVLGWNLLGDATRDLWDPRLRGSR